MCKFLKVTRGTEVAKLPKFKHFVPAVLTLYQHHHPTALICTSSIVEKNVDVQGRPKESQAKVYHIDLEHADKVLMATVTITAAPSAARRRKGVVIRDPKETATPSTIIHSEPKSKDKGKGILVEEPKPIKKQAQIEQEEAYARELKAELNKNINWDDVIE
nr:hypothetical protein [Tanacetum cinerariifolium]